MHTSQGPVLAPSFSPCRPRKHALYSKRSAQRAGHQRRRELLVVQKYGGTSVGTPQRILRVADRIADRRAAGDRIVAVVSAMGQTTDHLLSLAHRITPRPSRREMDMLLTTGERISMALLSMALEARQVPAISFTGSQSGIITDTNHTRARILEIRPIRILPELERDKVVIVAGFQGVSRDKEITTLGRGGSDTTAIALAVGLDADRCEIYTDVPGVMTADPRHVKTARLLKHVSWDTMLELAAAGAGVMHTRAVELAGRRSMPFCVRSAFTKKEGTVVEGKAIEQGAGIAAVTGVPRVLEVTMNGAADAAIMGSMQDLSGVRGLTADRAGCRLFVPADSGNETLLERLQGVSVTRGLAAVTLVGTGLLDIPRVVGEASKVLAASPEIPVHALVSTTIAVTLYVPEGSYGDALRRLHAAFLESARDS
jgi:aspartate kinase